MCIREKLFAQMFKARIHMTLLNRICTICLFIFLTTYNADSYKFQTKELENNTHFLLNYTSLKRLVEPLSYEILLKIPSVEINSLSRSIFSGRLKVLFIIEHPTIQINLNTHKLTITKEDIHLIRFPYKDSYKLTNFSYLNETETSILDFETEIPSGIYKMYINKFTGNISENETGLYKTICKYCNVTSRWIFVTQLKPTAARRVFPCWDDPVFRTRFDIEIQHHRNYTSLSNMPIREQQNIDDDIMETKFHSTPPIPAYLVAFVLMDFICSTDDQVDFTTRVCSTSLIKHEQMTYALKTSVNVIAYLQFRLQISPQFPEITHICLPDFSYEAAGNWGFNIYRENHLIYNETLHPIEHKLDVWMYVSSMVAFQWVGSLVSPTSWTHMWFSQTLALFYGVKAFKEMYDDKEITSLFIYRLQSLARENNIVSQVKPVMYPTNNRDENDRLIKSSHFTNCLKEYAIIAMLEYTVTESIFREATITYLEKYQFSTATPNNFWDILQDMIEEKEIFPTHPSIAQVVQSWLKQRSLPVITVTRKHTHDYIAIVIKTSHSGTEDDNNTDDLWIPINYIKKSSPEDVSRTIWVKTPNQQYDIRGISDWEWVIINWQNTGYYRVQYDISTSNILTTYLRSTERTKNNVLNRAHIIEDAYYFWTEEKIHIDSFLNLIYYMSYEEHCAPWYALQNIIQKMWPFLNIDVGRYAKHVIVSVLNDLLDKVGYTEHSNDTECIKFKRLLATKWACRLLRQPCLEIAQKRLFEHLRDPQKRIILPMWEEWTYCNGLALSNRSIWNQVWKEYKKTGNKAILIYLACSNNLTIIHHYLELAVWRDPIIYDAVDINSRSLRNIYRSIIKKHISKNEVFDYVLENIVTMEIYELVENLSYIIKHVYSKAQIEKISLLLLFETTSGLNPVLHSKLTSEIKDQLLRITKWEQLAN